MRAIKVELVAAALALALCAEATAGELQGKVVRVHDGDTITVFDGAKQHKVRLSDIDAPELHQAFGRHSRDALARLCAGVQTTVRTRGTDRYGRVLGQVECLGKNANAEQVRSGDAWVFVRYAPRNSPLYALQAEAKAARRGLWADRDPVPPWDWRRAKR